MAWDRTDVVVAEVAAGGCWGTGWTYGSPATARVIDDDLVPTVLGRDAFDPAGTARAMQGRCRKLGRSGVASGAISAVDIAIWDLKAKLLGVPLTRLFGTVRDRVPVYGSGGFTTYDDATTARQLEHWVGEWGMDKVKIKVGESWGRGQGRDLSRVALARRVLGDGPQLFVDANGAYSVKQATALGDRFHGSYGVTWFEEPVSSDDLAGLARVRQACGADVAAGEYGYDVWYFARMIEAGAVDCVQADVTRCGGYTGWLATAALCDAHHLEISGHCAPHLHAPVAAAVVNLRHVEYFHDHHRVDEFLFEGAAAPEGGTLPPGDGSAGHGLALCAGAERFAS
jgi:L-alanine-DL-glutamate epimerase-like enolase superfamily enzyme